MPAADAQRAHADLVDLAVDLRRGIAAQRSANHSDILPHDRIRTELHVTANRDHVAAHLAQDVCRPADRHHIPVDRFVRVNGDAAADMNAFAGTTRSNGLRRLRRPGRRRRFWRRHGGGVGKQPALRGHVQIGKLQHEVGIGGAKLAAQLGAGDRRAVDDDIAATHFNDLSAAGERSGTQHETVSHGRDDEAPLDLPSERLGGCPVGLRRGLVANRADEEKGDGQRRRQPCGTESNVRGEVASHRDDSSSESNNRCKP